MPTTELEAALSAAADAFEAHLTDAAHEDMKRLLANNQRPYVVRLLKASPGNVVFVQCNTEERVSP